MELQDSLHPKGLLKKGRIRTPTFTKVSLDTGIRSKDHPRGLLFPLADVGHLCRLVSVSSTIWPSEFGPSVAGRNGDTRGVREGG